MHRSGTSALAATLGALGIDLGDRLIPPHPPDNPKGYFEDSELYQINLELFDTAGAYWDMLRVDDPAQVDPPRYRELLHRAARIVDQRFGTRPRWALKNPRLVRNLGFWRQVTELAGHSTRFLVSLRHPGSVAASLDRRDGMHRRKALLLWLVHLIPPAETLAREGTIVVNYDDLLDSPVECMHSIGEGLGIETAPSSPRLAEHAKAFLSRDMRHHRIDWRPEDTAGDEIAQLCHALYRALDRFNVIAPREADAGRALETVLSEAKAFLARNRDWLACLDAETEARWKEIRKREQMIEASGRPLPYLRG